MFAKIILIVTLVALSVGSRKIIMTRRRKCSRFVTFLALVEDPETRVIGGGSVTLGQVPHMASLRSLSNVHFCGGSILNNRFILTSATCTDGKFSNAINIVVGSINLNTGGVVHRSNEIWTHPAFDRLTLANE